MYQPSRSVALKMSWICLAIAILVGAFLRFHNLGLKPYWEDEIYTATRIAGFQGNAIEQAIQGRVISVAELQQFFRVDLFHQWGDFFQAILSRPEQAPLYYILARIWAGLFGSEPNAMRALSAGLSLIALGLIYKLSMMLFRQQEGAVSAVCIASLSPLLLRYAQENRAYSLWIVLTLWSCIVLLKAIQVRQFKAWFLYGVTLILGLLTHWLFLLVLLAQTTYLFLLFLFGWPKDAAGFERNKQQENALQLSRDTWMKVKVACMIVLASTFPWGYFLIRDSDSVGKNLEWVAAAIPFEELLFRWELNLMRIFSSASFFEPGFPISSSNVAALFIFYCFVFSLLTFSVLIVLKLFSWQQWALPFLMGGYFAVPSIFSDLLLGGRISKVERYLLPLFLVVILSSGQAVGKLVHRYSNRQVSRLSLRQFCCYSCLALLWGILLHSSIQDVQFEHWWNYEDRIARVGEALPDSSRSRLLITQHRWGETFSLMNRLEPADQLLWLPSNWDLELPKLSQNSDVFLFNPSEDLKEQACKKMGSACSLKIYYKVGRFELWSLLETNSISE